MTVNLQNGKWVQSNEKRKVFIIQDYLVVEKHIATFDHPDVEFPTTLPVKWISGLFGSIPTEIEELTGKTQFNLKMGTREGLLTEDGKTIYTVPYNGVGIEKIQWVSDQEFQELLNLRESWKNPSTFYKIQPEINGKIVFLCGAPGAGKSSSAYLLAKHHGFVYYEGDCLMTMSNPYIPLDADNPTMQFVSQVMNWVF